jgi:hypothetical protein
VVEHLVYTVNMRSEGKHREGEKPRGAHVQRKFAGSVSNGSIKWPNDTLGRAALKLEILRPVILNS